MLRIIPVRLVPNKIQYNEIRLYRSINIHKSNSSRTKKHNEDSKDKLHKRCITFADNSLKSLEGNAGTISFVSYDTKTDTFSNGRNLKIFLFLTYNKETDTFCGTISRSDADQIKESEGYKGIGKPIKDYMSSLDASYKSFSKDIRRNLPAAMNIIKKPIPFVFGYTTKSAGRKKQNDGKDNIETNTDNIENVTSTESMERMFEQVKNPEGSFSSESLYYMIKILKSLLQDISGDISNAEKYKILLKWQDEINNIYSMMKEFSINNTSNLISQYCKLSESLKQLVMNISENEDYARLLPVLTCITIVSLQLLLLSYINIPFSDQVVDIALFLYHKAHLFKDDPNFQEIINTIMKKIEDHLPITSQSDWLWYINMIRKVSVIFPLVMKSWKESKIEFPDDKII